MSYDPTTDFVGLLRLTGSTVRSERMPGLDYVVSALSRSGLITLYVGQTAPTTSQATTVWFQPAVPSWAAEGTTRLWNADAGAYQVATPELWSVLIVGASVPAPGTTDPIMDGVATPGVLAPYSREDHVHPTDTSRASLVSPVFTGTPEAPTATLGDSTTKIATTQFVIQNGGLPPPVGSVLAYAGAAAPTNWAICDGHAVSRTGATADLFAVLGITFGAGDGITTFNIPDLRGRVVAGVDGGVNRLTTATMSSQALAGVGGTETELLTLAQMPAHAHTYTDPAHHHATTSGTAYGGTGLGAGSGAGSADPAGNTNLSGLTTSNSTVGITINNTGGGTAHPNVQPTMELNYIIRIS